MGHNFRNDLNMNGNHIINWRGEMLSQAQIDAIPLVTAADKEAQKGRMGIYNTTLKRFVHYDENKNAFVIDGSGEGALNYRGKLDCSIETSAETASLKKNPPSLDKCENGDVWIVAKSGIYTYIDAEGNTKTQQAEMGDLFQVFVKTKGATPAEDILDWMFVESATQQIELIFQYDSSNPDIKSWRFDSYSDVSGSILYDLYKLGYNFNMYKETSVTGTISGGMVKTRTHETADISFIEDKDTYSGKTVYSLLVEFGKPLVDGDKYVIVIK